MNIYKIVIITAIVGSVNCVNADVQVGNYTEYPTSKKYFSEIQPKNTSCIPPSHTANLIGIRNDTEAFNQLSRLIPKTCSLNSEDLLKILKFTNLQDDLLYAKAACKLLSRSTTPLHQDTLKNITKHIRGDKNRGIFNTCYINMFYGGSLHDS